MVKPFQMALSVRISNAEHYLSYRQRFLRTRIERPDTHQHPHLRRCERFKFGLVEDLEVELDPGRHAVFVVLELLPVRYHDPAHRCLPDEVPCREASN